MEAGVWGYFHVCFFLGGRGDSSLSVRIGALTHTLSLSLPDTPLSNYIFVISRRFLIRIYLPFAKVEVVPSCGKVRVATCYRLILLLRPFPVVRIKKAHCYFTCMDFLFHSMKRRFVSCLRDGLHILPSTSLFR